MVVYKALKLDSTAEAMLDQLAKHQMAGDWDKRVRSIHPNLDLIDHFETQMTHFSILKLA